MVRMLFTALILTQSLTTAEAGNIGLGRLGVGGFGFHRGGFFGASFAGQHVQSRFENRFDALMTDYESGLLDIEDFSASEAYSDIVSDLETLVDRHDFYVDRLERSVNRYEEVIARSNDALLSYQDHLDAYQERDDLSEEHLMRIEQRITWRIDSLNLHIETLNQRQADLEAYLPSVVTFNENLWVYLDEVVSMSMQSADPMESEAVAAMTASLVTAPVTTSLQVDAVTSQPLSASLASVPEPGSGLLLLSTFVGSVLLSRVRRRQRSTEILRSRAAVYEGLQMPPNVVPSLPPLSYFTSVAIRQ